VKKVKSYPITIKIELESLLGHYSKEALVRYRSYTKEQKLVYQRQVQKQVEGNTYKHGSRFHLSYPAPLDTIGTWKDIRGIGHLRGIRVLVVRKDIPDQVHLWRYCKTYGHRITSLEKGYGLYRIHLDPSGIEGIYISAQLGYADWCYYFKGQTVGYLELDDETLPM
jgi:hypothetical protein